MMARHSPRKRSNRKPKDRPIKETKAFKTIVKELNKHKKLFISRMMKRYQMSEYEAIRSWNNIHHDSIEVEAQQIMSGKKEMPDENSEKVLPEITNAEEEREPVEAPDYLTEAIMKPKEGEDESN